MIASLGLTIGVLVYLAFFLDLFGFMARDELLLRLLMLGASAFYLVYYYFVADQPLWDALITNGALAAVNLAMIGVVVAERTTYTMTREQAAIYAHFPLMSPGQFRRLMRLATVTHAESELCLTSEGKPQDALHYVIQGPLRLEKQGVESVIASECFIGEIAYLTGQPASASVWAGPGAHVLSWDSTALRRIATRHPGLRNALLGHFNTDLARKVSGSTPLARA